MYSESDLLPLSALQHFAFCQRQCALIHLEQQWEENRFTAEGRILHDRTHTEEREWRDGVLVIRALRIRSLDLGLAGVADVVELRGLGGRPNALPLPLPLGCQVVPVEYKRGKPKIDNCDEVQLCAQAMCLEEMLATSITIGEFYYGSQHKRHEVVLSTALREETRVFSAKLHYLLSGSTTPPAVQDKRCDACSLADRCMPGLSSKQGRIREYIEKFISI